MAGRARLACTSHQPPHRPPTAAHSLPPGSTYDGAVKSKPPSHPKPIPFIATGAIIGFVVFGLISFLRPNVNEAYDITYDAGAALGFMSVVGLCVGAFVAAVVVALLSYRK